LAWLRSHIHSHGGKYTPQELIQKVTGSPIHGEAYMRYLEKKFGAIYGF
jgi:carboxypeptidase Taq